MTYTLDQLAVGHHVTASDPNLTFTGTICAVDEDPALPAVEIQTDSGPQWVPVTLITEHARPLHEIAAQIRADWKKVHYAAEPYLEAMSTLDKITDMYLHDSADGIVRRFLTNSGAWRGETAREVKKELRAMTGQ